MHSHRSTSPFPQFSSGLGFTYDVGSNIFDSIKHCVAIGGVAVACGVGAMLGGWELRAWAAASGI